MVVLFLSGGLGNQLFQYLWAKELEKKFSLPISFCRYFYDDEISGLDRRQVVLDRIKGADLHWYQSSKLRKFYSLQKKWKKIIYYSFNIIFFFLPKSFIILNERYIFLLPALNLIFSDIVIYGIGKYAFNRNSAKEFLVNFECTCDGQNTKLHHPVDDCSIGVFVRRGDYVRLGLALNEIYYIDKINAHLMHGPGKIYIYSDDINWCKQNIVIENTKMFYEGQDLECPVCKIIEMSKFKRLVVSNSTFNFFAWQIGGDFSSKKIIYPREAILFRDYDK